MRDVLESPLVRQRIIDYLGGATLESASCRFVGRLDPLNPSRFERHPPAALHQLLDESCELARSLEDQSAMLIHLDIEYVNFDDPASAYLDPQRTFALQEPLVRVIEARLLSLGIRYLHVVTGQGHHFVWKIRKNSAVARAIAGLGIRTPPDQADEPDPLFPNISLLMEHLGHLLKAEAAPVCELPVEITALHVGPGASGMREMLSIDISEYGDPLGSRMIRIPYTVYRKPWISGLIDRMGIGHRVPEFFALPLHEMDIRQLIELRHRPETILELAGFAGVGIPLEEEGTQALLESYLGSGLARFHRDFYRWDQSFPDDGAGGIPVPVFQSLPPCARHVLAFPNDLLLKPSGMQLITRCLLAQRWPPRQIAGLIRSRFQDPRYGWNEQWADYDPAVRADFYVRLFAGQIDQGIERGVDFNCVSQQEKQFCWDPENCSLDPIFERVYGHPKPHPTLP